MKRKFFTFLMAFLATVGNAVWGQNTGSADNPIEINSSNKEDFTDAEGKEIYLGDRNNPGEYYYKLNGVSYTRDASACQVRPNCIVHILLEGDNYFQSGRNYPGIYVPTSSKLIIEGGSGTLTAECRVDGVSTDDAAAAGIGGGVGSGITADFGTIIIKGGTVTGRCITDGSSVTSHATGAGIGGGNGSTHGTIIILGGTVTAECIDSRGGTNRHAVGAAIGGGYEGTCDNITILGGNITVNNSHYTGVTDAFAANIGKGYKCSNKTSPSIIIGKWDKNTTTTINEGSTYTTDTDKLLSAASGREDDRSKGEVTLPAEMQIYLESVPTKVEKFNAYYMELVPSKIGEDNHTVNVYTKDDGTKTPDAVIEEYKGLYYGSGRTITVPSNLECTLGHHFMGWLKDDTSIEQPINGIGTVNSSETELLLQYKSGEADATNGIQKTTYTPVWVDNEQDILVKSGTNWTENTSIAPSIDVVPEAAISLLTYTLNTNASQHPVLNVSGQEVKFSNEHSNILSGTPEIQGEGEDNEVVEYTDVTATVSVGEKNVIVAINPFTCYKNEVKIVSVEITESTHTYDGKAHNGLSRLSREEDHLLTVKGVVGTETTERVLREGVFYRIYSYKKDNGNTELASESDNSSIELKDKGTYSEITIETIGGTTFDDSKVSGASPEGQVYRYQIPDGTVTINPRTITVTPDPNQKYIIGQTEALKITFTPAEGEKAINVEGINETIHYTGNLGLEGVTDGNNPTDNKAYKITLGTLALANATDNNGFLAENYELKLATEDAYLNVLKDISTDQSLTITIDATNLTYNGQLQDPNVSVSGGTEGNYNISIEGAEDGKVKNAGTYTVTVTGNEEKFYTGTKTETFTVKAATITAAKALPQTVTLGKVAEEFNEEATAETVELTGIVDADKENVVFDTENSSLKLAQDASNYTEAKTYTDAIQIEELALGTSDNFLASNYDLTGLTFDSDDSKGDLTVEGDDNIEVDPEQPEGGEGEDGYIKVNEDGTWSLIYDGKNHNNVISAITVKLENTEKALTTDQYSVTYTSNGNNVDESTVWNVGTYTATITLDDDLTDDLASFAGKAVTQTINVTARTLNITINDQTIEATGSVNKNIVDGTTVTIGNKVDGETPAFADGAALTCDGTFEAGHIYTDAIKWTESTELKTEDSFNKDNYSLPESIAAADLTVKQSIDGGDGTDPIDPTDPDDEGNPIILPDGWTWDATSKGFRVTYDGNDHEVSALKVKFTDSESGESTHKELASEYIEEVTYSPSKPHDAGDYTASIEIKENDLIKAGTYTIKLQVVKREMYVDFILPSTIESTAPLAITNSRVKYEAQSGIRGLLTKEQYPVIESGQFIFGKPNAEGQCTVTIHNFILATSTSGFKPGNYQLQVWDAEVGDYVDYNNDGDDVTIIDPNNPDEDNPNNPGGGDSGVVVDPDGDDDDDHNPGHGGSDINRPAKYYNMYVDSVATCDGVELWFDKNVVRAGNQASVYVKIEEGYDAEHMKLWFKRSLYGYWEELEEGVQPGEYIIYNVYTDIYVKATDVEKDPTGIEEIEGVKVYAQNGSIYVYTPNRLPVWIVSMTGAVVRNEEQVGLQQYDRLNQGIYIVRVGEQVFKIRL